MHIRIHVNKQAGFQDDSHTWYGGWLMFSHHRRVLLILILAHSHCLLCVPISNLMF